MFRGENAAGAAAHPSLQDDFAVSPSRPRKARIVRRHRGSRRCPPSFFRIGDAGGHVGNAASLIGQTMTGPVAVEKPCTGWDPEARISCAISTRLASAPRGERFRAAARTERHLGSTPFAYPEDT